MQIKVLPEKRDGYRKGTGKQGNNADVQRIIEKAKEYPKELNMLFID